MNDPVDDGSFLQDHAAPAQVGRHLDVVRDHDDGVAACGEFAEEGENFLPGPGIEIAGGQIDEVTGKRCTLACFPIRYRGGEASLVRLVAIVDE